VYGEGCDRGALARLAPLPFTQIAWITTSLSGEGLQHCADTATASCPRERGAY
jgi:hypothetical protein